MIFVELMLLNANGNNTFSRMLIPCLSWVHMKMMPVLSNMFVLGMIGSRLGIRNRVTFPKLSQKSSVRTWSL